MELDILTYNCLKVLLHICEFCLQPYHIFKICYLLSVGCELCTQTV